MVFAADFWPWVRRNLPTTKSWGVWHFLLMFQEVRPISKTGNQLHQGFEAAACGFPIEGKTVEGTLAFLSHLPFGWFHSRTLFEGRNRNTASTSAASGLPLQVGPLCWCAARRWVCMCRILAAGRCQMAPVMLQAAQSRGPEHSSGSPSPGQGFPQGLWRSGQRRSWSNHL